MRSVLTFIVVALTGVSAWGAQPHPPSSIPGIHIGEALLQQVEAALRPIEERLSNLSIESLDVNYAQGHRIEKWAEVLQKEIRLTHQLTRQVRSGDSVLAAFMLSSQLHESRIALMRFTDNLFQTGAGSAELLKLATSLEQLGLSLDQVQNPVDARLLTTLDAADAALHNCK